jgi:hypothetical protein
MDKETALRELQDEIHSVTRDGWDQHTTLFTANEVAEVLGYLYNDDGGWGAYNLSAIVRLKDGRFGAYSAWADTSGHGCRCDVQTSVEPTLDELLNLHFTEAEIKEILDTIEEQQ